MKKLTCTLLALSLSTMIYAKEIKIGVILPLTGSLAAYGQDVYGGIELAHKLNPKSENGDAIKLVVVDSKGDKIETSNAATRLTSVDKVIAMIGEAITTNTMQVIAVAENKKIPMIAPVASGDKLLNNKFYSSRVCFMDSFQGQKFADYVSGELALKNAVIIIDQANVYSLGLAKVFEEQFKKNGGKINKKFTISSGDKDFKALAAGLKNTKTELVYMPIYHPEAALIAKEARAVGFDGLISAGDGVNNKTFIELGGKAVNGVIFTDSFDAHNPSTKIGQNFINEYEKAKGTKEVPAFTAMGADAYLVMLRAINLCANNLNSECVNTQIHQTKNYESVGGLINIDQSGNASRSVVVKEIVDGKQVYKTTIEP